MKWTREFPSNAAAGDVFYWAKRIGSKDVTLAGFSMGKMWVNGVAYEASEVEDLEFLGPVVPEHSELFSDLGDALMPDNITPTDPVARARRLIAAATPGEWTRFVALAVIEVDVAGDTKKPIVHWAGFDSSPFPLSEQAANAELIANCKPLLAQLADEVEALKVALERSARYGHAVGGYHSPNFVKFDECKKAECATAREALEAK